jgi:hypothetical protein
MIRALTLMDGTRSRAIHAYRHAPLPLTSLFTLLELCYSPTNRWLCYDCFEKHEITDRPSAPYRPPIDTTSYP